MIISIVGVVLVLLSLVDDVFDLAFIPTWLNWVFYIVGVACAYWGIDLVEKK